MKERRAAVGGDGFDAGGEIVEGEEEGEEDMSQEGKG